MFYLWSFVLVVLNAFWLFLVVLGLPGTWLMLLSAAIFAWAFWDPALPRGEQVFHPLTLIGLAGLALLGELLEFAAGLVGAKRAGGTRAGALGALLGTLAGGLIGTFAIPILFFGSLVGACVGAAAGAIGFELYAGGRFELAVSSGVGAGVGRLGGTLAKAAVGALMWLVIVGALLWR